MSWHELTVEVAAEEAESIGDALLAAGAAGVEEQGGEQVWDEPQAPTRRLRAWFEDPDRQTVEALLGAGAAVRWQEVQPTDWEAEWRAAFPPIEVSPTLTIAPPWDAPPGALLIEPGQGFGTAHHPTTRLALRALEAAAGPGTPSREVLDVGCGSGILALAAARWGHRARGVELEPEAIPEARHNAVLNGLQAEFQAGSVEQLTEAADVVIANIHAELLHELRPHLLRLTRETLILSGVLEDREAAVRAAYEQGGHLQLTRREAEQGWLSLVYTLDP